LPLFLELELELELEACLGNVVLGCGQSLTKCVGLPQLKHRLMLFP
jgi:hypothetical protein